MKVFFHISAFVFLFMLQVQAQTTASTSTLLPDQNPNYEKSRDKYMAKSDDLTSKEGTTVQQTYKAIDDMQIKQERKDLAAQRRHERRMARIQSRGNRQIYNPYYYNGYNNPYGYYHPYYYYNNIYGNVNSIANTALLGIAIWSLLKK